MMPLTNLLLRLWRALNGPWRWYLLWLTNHKFMVGVAGVIIDQEGRILLLRHRFWPEGSWGLPGGYVKKGEKLEEALAREVAEETGYQIEVDALLQVVSGFKLRLEVHYLGHLSGGSFQLDPKEVLEACFFNPTELPDGLLAANRRVIQLALARPDFQDYFDQE
jgi:ADP-ribose pyrophosphatase YjhB (NUDIX family)